MLQEKELEVQVLQLNKRDIVLYSIDPEKYTLDEAFNIHKKLQKDFQGHKVIMIPDKVVLSGYSKKEALKAIEDLKEYIEE